MQRATDFLTRLLSPLLRVLTVPHAFESKRSKLSPGMLLLRHGCPWTKSSEHDTHIRCEHWPECAQATLLSRSAPPSSFSLTGTCT